MTDESSTFQTPVGLLSSAPSHERSELVGVREIGCRTEATGYLQQRHYIRDLAPLGNDTLAAGGMVGPDKSPTPSEALLAALGSCLSNNVHANALARSIPIKKLIITSTAEVNYGALWGATSPGPIIPGIHTIRLNFLIEGDAPREVFKSLMDFAVLWSPLSNTLHNPVHLDVVLEKIPAPAV